MQILRAVAAAAALCCLATVAAAATIDSVGDAFDVEFDGNIETADVAGLSAAATFSVTGFDAAAGVVVLEIALHNSTDTEIWQSARISAIGFDVDAALVSATASGLFSFAVQGGKFPNQFGPVDVCAIDNHNNCSGGRDGGLHVDESGTLTLALTFSGPIASLDLRNFGVRYQSLDSDELCFRGASGTGAGTPLPESSALALLGAGALAAAAWRARRHA